MGNGQILVQKRVFEDSKKIVYVVRIEDNDFVLYTSKKAVDKLIMSYPRHFDIERC